MGNVYSARRLRTAALLAGATLVGACQSASTRQVLDGRSGVTWTVERDPAAFARTETRYSRSARDYVYLGPVEINRRGVREYLIWVGVGTTLDRGYVAPENPVPDRLYLEVRGEPFELELLPWSARVPELKDVSVYSPNVRLEAELAARVTLDQVRLLSGEAPSEVRIGVADGPTLAYFRWRDWSGWSGFVAEAGGVR